MQMSATRFMRLGFLPLNFMLMAAFFVLSNNAVLGESVLTPDGYANILVSPGGTFVVVENVGKTRLELVNARTWTVISSTNLERPLNSLVMSPDGHYLAAWDAEHVIVWKTGTLKQVCKLSNIPVSKVIETAHVAFFPDNSLFVTNDVGGDIYTLKDGTFQKSRHVTAGFGETEQQLSRNGRFFACGGEGFLKIWDTRTWRPLACFQGIWSDGDIPQDASIVRFSFNSEYIYAGQHDIDHIFRTSDWKRVDDDTHFAFTKNHTDAMDGAFSQDGTVFATEGTKIMFWNVRTGQRLGPLDGIKCSGLSIDFVPFHNQVIITNDSDLGAELWPIPK